MASVPGVKDLLQVCWQVAKSQRTSISVNTTVDIVCVGSMNQNPAVKGGDVKKVADSYVDYFDASKGNTEKQRVENYEEVVNSYYDLATDFYEYGWGQSFHFATQAKGEAYTQAIARHEHWLALQLQLKREDLVLVGVIIRFNPKDCGCGVGGPAREIARFSGAHVTGINNNAYQVPQGVHV